MISCALLLLLMLLQLSCPGFSVKITKLEVPRNVTEGSGATLNCYFLLSGGEKLRSVRWFFEALEFYRFAPEQVR